MKGSSVPGIVARLAKMVHPLAPVMTLCILTGIAGHLSAIAMMAAGATMIGLVLSPEPWLSFEVIASVLLCAAALKGVFKYVEQYAGHYVAFTLLAIIRNSLFEALSDLAPARLADKRSGDIVSTTIADVEIIETFFAHTIAPVAIALAVPVIVLAFTGTIWIGFPAILLVFYLAIGVGLPLLTTRLPRKAGREYREKLAGINSRFTDCIQGIRELLLFGAAKGRLEEINADSTDIRKPMAILKRHESAVISISDGLVLAATIAVFIASLWACSENLITLAEALAVTVIAYSSFGPVLAIGGLSNDLMHTFAAAERIFAILDEKPAVADKPGAAPLPAGDGGLAFSDVWFRYPGKAGEDVIAGLSLDVKPGSKIGIMGGSGCGKTSLLRLAVRFWDPDSGKVTVAGTDVKDYRLANLRSGVSMVSQDTYLFDTTILDNIRLGKPDATADEVMEAARRASLDQFPESLPRGLDTRVGEAGENLSGGERQRIAIARALIQDNPVLLLDEPTSSLDVLNEKAVLKNIGEEFAGRTVVMVSHRRSGMAIVDRVYILEGGRLALRE